MEKKMVMEKIKKVTCTSFEKIVCTRVHGARTGAWSPVIWGTQ